MVPVYNYAVSRGECSDFASSANPDIASNYGVDCQGIRVPSSARSTYQFSGKLNYTFGTGSRLAFTALGQPVPGPHVPRKSGRARPVPDLWILYNPGNLPAFRNYSNVFTLNWTQNLSRSTERALALETYLSYQQDRTMRGPMTRESELGSRDPFGGFMLCPIDFLFNFDNFPLDDELVAQFPDQHVRHPPVSARPREPGAVRHRR